MVIGTGQNGTCTLADTHSSSEPATARRTCCNRLNRLLPARTDWLSVGFKTVVAVMAEVPCFIR
jgi:hypothetical protein